MTSETGTVGLTVAETKDTRRYHHGDLRHALLDAALALLADDGANALTLRKIAKRAGVSHAAPAHHFGDLDGLLDALATLGYERLAASMRRERAGHDDPQDRLEAIGVGYVAFAVDEPELFAITFRRPPERYANVGLVTAARQSYAELEDAVAGVLPHAGETVRAETRTALWSLVHGYAALHVAGQMERGPRDELGQRVRAIMASMPGPLERNA